MVLFLNNDDVRKVLTLELCMDALEDIFKEFGEGNAVRKPRIDVAVPEVEPGLTYRYASMEGASKKYGTFAVRMYSNMTYTSADGTRNEIYSIAPGTYLGLILLFSIRTAELLAVITDGYLQHMRVGATAAIAAQYLSNKKISTVGIIGSGGMARTHLEALCRVREISEARVYSPTVENRSRYAAAMSELLGLRVTAVDSPEKAVSGADIVATCTNANRPVFKGEWLHRGMFITNVTDKELDAEAGKGVDKLVTLDQLIMTKIRGAFIRYEPGKSDQEIEESIKGFSLTKHSSLIDVMAGREAGRRSADEMILFHNNGHEGLQFPSVAATVYQHAKKIGLGREVPSELFLQDIKN